MMRRAAMVFLSLMLAACASAPQKPVAAFWSGRMGLQVQSDPPQSLQATFELQGNAQTGELTLLNLLGGVLARLSWTPQQALLERGSERWVQPNVEQLTQQFTQTSLPVQALFDWIGGRAVPYAGWQADLSAHDQGIIVASRIHPPTAQLRIVLDR